MAKKSMSHLGSTWDSHIDIAYRYIDIMNIN